MNTALAVNPKDQARRQEILRLQENLELHQEAEWYALEDELEALNVVVGLRDCAECQADFPITFEIGEDEHICPDCAAKDDEAVAYFAMNYLVESTASHATDCGCSPCLLKRAWTKQGA